MNSQNPKDRKSTRLNSSHRCISYAVFCLKKKIVSELRARGVFTPVLLLTARDELEARVRGLEGGADDYLTKPFDLPELLARVHALIRRAELRHKHATLNFFYNVPDPPKIYTLSLHDALPI